MSQKYESKGAPDVILTRLLYDGSLNKSYFLAKISSFQIFVPLIFGFILYHSSIKLVSLGYCVYIYIYGLDIWFCLWFMSSLKFEKLKRIFDSNIG